MMASCSQHSFLYAYDILLVKYIPDLRLAGTITGVTVKLCNGTNADYLRELLLFPCYLSLAEKHTVVSKIHLVADVKREKLGESYFSKDLKEQW